MTLNYFSYLFDFQFVLFDVFYSRGKTISPDFKAAWI
jgi:hypothetical protein